MNDTPAPVPDARARRLRWFGGAMVAAVLLALLQGANVIYSQGLARQAAQAVLRHEAEGWIRALGSHLRDRDGMPSSEALSEFLEDAAPEGLRYAGFFVGEGPLEIRREAGRPAAPVVLSQLRPAEVTWVDGSQVRFSVPARSPRRAGPPAFDPTGTRTGAPDGRRSRGRAAFVVEFEPRVYPRVLSHAQRTLALGTATASLVVLLAAWAFLALRRRHALEKQAERAQHLAALGEMSAVLAHEIRNPLASVKGNAQLLVEDLQATAGAERARTKAARVVEDATRIERITSDLLDFVRSGPLEVAPTDLGALVRLTLEDVVPAERLRLTLPSSPLMVPVDASRLRQVIENLARNAVQAGAAEGTGAGAGGGTVEAELAPDSRQIVLTIRDHGPGIPAGQEERIFEPFVTTRTRGTGLGLAIARRLAERHGGSLTAANHPEGGAVFRLILTLPARSR